MEKRSFEITIVVAMDKQGGIGCSGKLPWHLPADLRHFKEITMGHALIMGRRTYSSIGRALPGRQNIVLSRNNEEVATKDIERADSFTKALHLVNQPWPVMVMGGASVYETALPLATHIYLTEIHATMPCDTFFPKWQRSKWHEVARSDHPSDERHRHPYSFIHLMRRPA